MMVSMTVRMHLVLGIPCHVARVPTVLPASGQVPLVMMFRAVGSTRPTRMTRRSAQRGGSRESPKVQMRRMRTMTMRVTATMRAVVHHLRMMTHAGRE